MKRLGQFLVELGWISTDDLARALQSQEILGGSLGTCLLELEVITEERLLKALSHQVGADAPRTQDLRNIPPEVYQLIPAKLAVRCAGIAFRMLGDQIHVAMSDAHNLAYQDEIAFATGKDVRPYVAHEARIYEALERYYSHKCPRRYRDLLNVLNGARDPRSSPPSQWSTLPTAPSAENRAPRDREMDQSEAGLKAEVADYAGDPAGDDSGPIYYDATQSQAPLTFDELKTRLDEAQDSNEVGRHVLQYLAPTLKSVALFMIRRQEILGWMGLGDGLDQQRLRQFRIDFRQPSVFLNLRQGGLFYTGPLPSMVAHKHLARCWGGKLPRHCLVLPVRVHQRLVSVLICDPGRGGLNAVNLDDLQLLAARAADALGHCILRNKQRPA